MELIVDGIDIFNPLKGKLDILIDSFCEVYGEKHRKRIKNRIKNNHFIFVPESFSERLSEEYLHYFSKQKSVIFESLFSKFTEDKDKIELFYNTTDIEDLINAPSELYDSQNSWLNTQYVNKILQFLEIVPTRKKMLNQKAKELGIQPGTKEFEELNENFFISPKELNKEELIDLLKNPAIKQVVDLFIKNLKKEYETKGYKERINYINKNEKQALFQTQEYDDIISKLREKHKSELVSFAQKYIPNSNIISKLPQYKIDEICSSFLELASLDMSKKNNLEFLGSYKKSKYVTTLKTFGLDFGENFEDYISNPKIQEFLFNPKFQDKLKALKDNQTLELLNNNEIFLSILKQADKINPTVGTLAPMEYLYSYIQNRSFVSAFADCFISQRGKLHTVTVCRTALSGTDKTLIHEIGHIIEASMPKQTEKNKTTTISGFHVLTNEHSNEKYDGKAPLKPVDFDNKTYNKYELLNEIINDYFSVEVTKNLHAKGINLNLGEQDEKSNSLYSRGFCLIEPFILKYKQELIDARLSDNPLAFKEAIGENNFDTLADTCTEFIKSASISENYRNFIKEVNSVNDKLNQPYKHPVYDLLNKDVKLSENAQKFLKHFKTVQSVMELIEEKQKG